MEQANNTNSSQQSDNSKLWKQFGRENDVGKMLFSLYSAPEKPKINYPPLKTKPRQETLQEEKKCPQKTMIEYPEPAKKAYRKFHPVDFIPKRKAAEEILEQIEQDKNRPLQAPIKRGVNRKKMITELQERFQFKDKEELEAYLHM